MVALVTLDRVKEALRVDTEDDNDLLDLYILAASEAVLKYLKSQAGEIMDLDAIGGSPADLESVPENVAVATIFLVGHFYREPDGNTEQAFEQGYLPKPVTALLYPLRDPAIA